MADIRDLRPRLVTNNLDRNDIASTAVVAAVAGSRIYVTDISLLVNGDQRVQFRSAATALGTFDFAASGVVEEHARLEDNPGAFIFRTAVGEALNMDLDAAVRVSGYVRTATIADA